MTAACEIMHTGATCIGEHDTLATAQGMRELDVAARPICGDNDRLHGIVTGRDIVVKCVVAGLDPATMTATDLAQGNTYQLDSGASVEQGVTVMEVHQIRRLPVLDDHRLVGMISEVDIARHLPDHAFDAFGEAICAPRPSHPDPIAGKADRGFRRSLGDRGGWLSVSSTDGELMIYEIDRATAH
ncbi:CBS domain-containing protein (plasmid) [Rhodococcus qingshengii]|nr:CBS domain-containing protein [Rhodococcus qingshengii]